MTTHEYRILIGASGWQHPAWQDDFYPEDLPEDWQLGYYSNEFPIVLIPADVWTSIKDEIEDWLEDCHDEMKVVCAIPEALTQLPVDEAIPSINAFMAELAMLADRLLAVILPINQPQLDLSTLMSGINGPCPVCLELSQSMDAEEVKPLQKVCEERHWPVVWHGEDEACCLGNAAIAIGRINSQHVDMRQLGSIVETMLKQTTLDQTSIMFVDGTPPDIKTMRNANVILDLF